jgi:hypothetical protein
MDYIEYNKKLNRAGFKYIFKNVAPITVGCIFISAYYMHCTYHERQNEIMFKGKSKLYEGKKIQSEL